MQEFPPLGWRAALTSCANWHKFYFIFSMDPNGPQMNVDLKDNENLKSKPACLFCKKRKIKCSRGHPCTSCKRLSKECVYADLNSNNGKRKISKPSKKSLELEIENLKSRIEDLRKNMDNETVKSSHHSVANLDNKENLEYSSVPSLDSNSSLHENQDQNPPGGLKFKPYTLDDADSTQFEAEFAELLRLVEENDCDEDFNLFRSATNIIESPGGRRNFGLFSWKTIATVDPCLLAITSHAKAIHSNGKGPLFENEGPHSKRLQNYITDNIEPLERSNDGNKPGDKTDANGNSYEESRKTLRLNGGLRSVNLFASSRKSVVETVRLKQRIEAFLPPKTVISKLMDQFFARLYTFLPIIDETDFRAHLYRMFDGPTVEDKCTDLKLQNKLDFARLGMLLLILRMSYLSLLPLNPLSNNPKKPSNAEEAAEIAYMLKHPINIEAVTLAQDCVNLFNLFGIPNMTLFQLLLVMRVYYVYGPEQGDGCDQGDAQALNSILFEIAYALGIHRDPDSIRVFQDEKSKNLVRKMWSLLLLLDLSHSLEFGDPLNVNKFSYDTKLPVFKIEKSNLVDYEREKFVIECYKFLDVCFKPLRGFINELLDVNNEISIIKLCKKLRYLRATLFCQNGVIKTWGTDFFDHDISMNLVNLTKYKIQLQFSHFICSLYFYLFNHFEKKKLFDVAFYYVLNLLNKILLVLLPFYFEMANLNTIEPTIDFILVPGVETMLHKASLFIFSMITRIRIQIITLKNSPHHSIRMMTEPQYKNRFENLGNLFDKLSDVSETLGSIADAYSKKYFYSWMISRMNRFFLSIVRSEEFEQKIYRRDLDFPILADNDKVVKMIEILDLCLSTKSRLSRFFPLKKSSNGPATQNGAAPNFTSNDMNSKSNVPSMTDSSYDRPSNSMGGLTPGSYNSESLDTASITSKEVDDIWIQLLGSRSPPGFPETNIVCDVPHFNFQNDGNNFSAPLVDGEARKEPQSFPVPGYSPMPNSQYKPSVDAFVLDELFKEFE